MTDLQLKKTAAVFLILVNALHVFGALLPDGGGIPSIDFVSVRRNNGERTVAAHLGGVWAIETATGELPKTLDSGDPSFIFREVTDGEQLFQVVYDGSYTPKNCFESAERDAVQDLQGRVLAETSPIPTPDTSSIGLPGTKKPQIVNTLDPLLPYFQYTHNTSDHTLTAFPSPAAGGVDFPPLLRSMVRLDLVKSHCDRLQIQGGERERRSLLTYPKTLWCGKGTQATHYDELGEEATTDMCCRDHDNCPHPQIDPMERKLFLRNIAPYTISDCRCDKAFHKCLKKARSPVANGVGDVYFNRLKIKCFVTRKKDQCLETSWFGACLRREKTDTAVARDARPFPEGKNLTKAEKALRRRRRRGSPKLS